LPSGDSSLCYCFPLTGMQVLKFPLHFLLIILTNGNR
jgi:hypothetical protein